jgi:diaminopimelate epimerase
MKKAPSRQGKPIPFYKLHGAGNDILVVETKDLPKRGKPNLLRRMAHRQTGIGCDQVMEVLSRKPLKVQVWNGDGTKAEMCGNGARALLFLAENEGWVRKGSKGIPITISGKPYVAGKNGSHFELGLGTPVVSELQALPLQGNIPYYEVNVGNPHCVILVGEGGWPLPADYSLKSYGSRIERHERFPKKTNVEFVRSWSQKGKVVEAQVDAWERGAGATLSCGSGAVAVAAVLRKQTAAEAFRIKMTDYELKIRFEGGKAFLSGPSALVAKGIFY